MNLSAFHSAGLWLAVITRPPAAPWCSTANCAVGVGTRPHSTTVTPTDCKPARAAASSMGPESRASRASTTRTGLPRALLPLPALVQRRPTSHPKAAA